MSKFNPNNVPPTTYSVDCFLCGALITDSKNTIVYVNNYFESHLLWKPDELVGQNINKILTKSSRIFFQSYLIPTVLHEKKSEEMQLIIFNGQGRKTPMTINAQINEEGLVFWSLFNATKQDQLYDELIKTREKLEEQAEKLKSLAATDELTGLLNRREMNYRSGLLLDQSLRSKQTIALLVIDIDDFKIINDTFGHLEGDRVLKELGQVLKNFGRQTDLISRYGGEEFLIMLPDTDKKGAVLFCNRLHTLIATVLVNDNPVTVSIGLTISNNTKSFLDLFTQADNAVYEAKARGKNRTQLYGDKGNL
ncbi:diguanylate cyclase [Pseudoalteromonas sp. 10-33]|uniref:diguanylate cyclase n=1 Tax=Pseudoalteromonas sp. 10-33 TaxID=1761890 RepID=UPI0009E6752A|nr:diguanylate cyclase [Pseudoalteromonas sp. 10-33]